MSHPAHHTAWPRRRILSAWAAWAVAPQALAQPAARPHRIGILSHSWEPARVQWLLDALQQLGYDEARGTTFDIRYAQGSTERLAPLARELVAAKADVIVCVGNLETLAAKAATSTIPIVMVIGIAPVETGLVASLARPGGNVTGTTLQTPEIAGKFLELLKEVVPGLKRVALMWEPALPGIELYRLETERAAAAMRIRLDLLPVDTPADLDKALARLADERPDGLFISPTGTLYVQRARIIELAARQRLPAIYASKVAVREGGLMSYIADQQSLVRRDAAIVDRLLRGAPAAGIPVEQPTRYELVINLRTARALGLAIPQSLLQRADEVIR